MPKCPKQHHTEEHHPRHQYVTRNRDGDDLPAEFDLYETLNDDADKYQPSVATEPRVRISTEKEK